MLKLHTIFVLLLISGAVNAQHISLQEIFFSGKYSARTGSQTRFLNTSADYTQLNTGLNGYQTLESFHIATGHHSNTFLETKKLDDQIYIDDYEFSRDDQMILLTTEEEQIYRHSTQAFHYIFDIGSGALSPLDVEQKQMYPQFSPDHSRVAYIVENDMYYRRLPDGEITRITRDGAVNRIINGRPDWVYEEEFTKTRMYEWSEDGSKILFLRFDETEVPEFSFMRYDGSYPKTETFKYPRAGEANSRVSLKMYDTEKDSLVDLEIPFEYEYIPWIIPAGDGFAFMLLNRHQNHLRIVYYNPETASFRQIYEYRDKRYIDLPYVFDYIGSGEFMITSERDGYSHLYVVSSGRVRPVTFGQFEVTAFYGMDRDGWIYYQSSRENATERHVYKLNFETGEEAMLTSGAGYHNATFAGDYTYFVQNFSAQGIPPVISVCDNNGQQVRMIEDNLEVRERLAEFWSPREFIEVPVSGKQGDYTVNTWMIKPPDFDPEKKYPVFMFVYGGPGNQRVRNEYFGLFGLWFQHIAQLGYIVMCADNRGTPGRGADYKKANYLQLGKPEVEDQLAVIKYLDELPYVDTGRIGYYGWSYGAYLSMLMLFQGKGVVKAALCVAPVTHWKFYDTIYTERYMRTPAENPKGYENGAPVNAVGDWKSGSLFIAHGTADDNVHFQNTTELVKKLNSRGKHYDLYIYPDGAHGMGGYGNVYHLFVKMTQFIQEKL